MISEKHQNILFLALTMCVGLFIFFPFLDFQLLVSQGDHGRDLYVFAQTMQGATPYKDYWWVYGPLMPYYYSFVFKFLGVNIASVLAGKILLQILSGFFFYRILRCLTPPSIAFIGTLWFWTFFPDFFFTYNHAGGITMMLATVYALFRFIADGQARYLYLGLAAIFILSLIKINIGFSVLLGFTVTVFLSDRINGSAPAGGRKLFFLIAAIGMPVLVISVYALLVHGLPVYALRQCFPYLTEDHPHNVSLSRAVSIYAMAIWQNMIKNWVNGIFAFILIGSILRTFHRLWTKKDDEKSRRQIVLVAVALCLLGTLNLHEFLKSGVFYRTFWAQPLFMLLIFIFIAAATRGIQKSIHFALCAVIGLMAFMQITHKHWAANIRKDPAHYMAFERGKIFTGNRPVWHSTVQGTVRYLNEHLKKDELFFALPYDPLYYFLTAKDNPTRKMIFFEHINIPPVQEQKVIAALEKEKVNYILISSRAVSGERGLGRLGETYCPILGKYINENFEVVATFGDWENPPGWAWHHGVKILKRNK